MVYAFDENLNKVDVKDKATQDGVDSGQDSRLTALESGKADSTHTHDDRYYTESEVDSKLTGRLPNFVNNIGSTNAGNPRQVKFISVDYNTKATYFKMSATSCHDNGTSYQFLEDIIIGVTTSGDVTCNITKYCQIEAPALDGVTRNYGDVFYTVDTTAKVVDFYILMGQYASAQFTPPTKIGNTTIQYVTPLTGSPVYYSTGDKVWANGNSAVIATTASLDVKQDTMSAGTGLAFDGTTINHSNSIAEKTTYVGSGTAIPRIKYDSEGHITETSTVTVYPPTTAGSAGQVWVSDGAGTGSWKTLVTISTADPSGGSNGDLWFKYE